MRQCCCWWASRRCDIYRKEIVYDAETGDYRMRLDGELVGWEKTYQAAEAKLDALVLELLHAKYWKETL